TRSKRDWSADVCSSDLVAVAGDIEGADDGQGAAGDVEGAAGDTPPSLLVLSFYDIARDARVLKQVTMFSTDYRVMTCGYGPTPRSEARRGGNRRKCWRA